MSDGAGGAIITWQDYRSGNSDISAQNIDRLGNLGAGKPKITAITAIVNDQGGKVRVTWNKSSADISATKIPYFTFLVTAHTNNPNNFYISSPDSGYSVDNLAPSPPSTLIAQVIAGPSVRLDWNKNRIDPDVGVYEVHRSITEGFTPSGATKIGQSTDTVFTDGSPVNDATNYYRIVTVDIHGNQSSPSPEASATLQQSVTRQYSVQQRWNLVSVPLTVDDYTKTVLYPTAISDAYACNGGYVTHSTLVSGRGYWLKFSDAEEISMTGFVRLIDTIDVTVGWNLIGSISEEIAVSQIASNPPNMITSQFFGYEQGYRTSEVIEPGKGYWVKVNQSGQLILSSTVVSSSQTIRIVPTAVLPPFPPDGELSNPKTPIPKQFALEQNYPNPFNPVTVIRFQLPVSSYVTLKVYSIRGEEVAAQVNEMQDAGYKSVEFDASRLSSGVYYYKLSAGEFVDVKKLVVTK